MSETYTAVRFENATTCRLCKSEGPFQPAVSVSIPDIETGDDRFHILACPACGLAFTDPVPSADTIHHLYAASTSTDYELPQPGLIGRLKDRFAERHIARSLRNASGLKPARILDFGTGGGRFAAACARVFPDADVAGTDFAATPPQDSYFQSRPRLRYVPYDALDAEAPFDVIVARHVLEHLHDPVAALVGWLSRLTPDGVLFIEVPNFRSQTAKLLGRRWPLLYVPKHLSHFDRASLRRTLDAAGATATIGRCELPMMGNVAALLLGADRFNPRFRIVGLGLHWVQLALETSARQGTCLTALVRRASS